MKVLYQISDDLEDNRHYFFDHMAFVCQEKSVRTF